MAATQATSHSDIYPASEEQIVVQCPQCLQVLGILESYESGTPKDKMTCVECGFSLEKTRGVWRSLTPQQQVQYAPFLAEYEEVRRREGRGSDHPVFYLALPYSDLTQRFSAQWKIRSKSYRLLERKILPKIEDASEWPLRVLDLGAGNGWLSYRLALNGHRPVAVDLSTSDLDGLEAARHYAPVLYQFFPRFQAAMDRLPFADGQFDVAIFNASFHYSTNYRNTLREVIRCLTENGKILIIDSPTYRYSESGRQMQAERRSLFEKMYGFASNRLPSQDFLTAEMIEGWTDLGISWETYRPWYGVKWALRPWIAKLKKRREPSKFHIYLGHLGKA